MNICGFQKLTLLDFPGHTACTVFTGGCNLRCPFCHNALLVTEVDAVESYDPEEIFSYLEKRKKILDGVAVTGGEPLLWPGTRDFIERVKSMGCAVKLDTNGFFPAYLKELVRDGLVDYVAVDIKNSKEKYAETTGRPGLDLSPLCETVDFLLSEPVDYEFRTTAVREFHTAADIAAIGAWIRGAKRYFLQKFVDSGNLIGEGLHEISKNDMAVLLAEARKTVPSAELRGI